MAPRDDILIQMSQTLGEVKGVQEAHGEQLSKIENILVSVGENSRAIAIIEDNSKRSARWNSLLVATGLVAVWEGAKHFLFGN